MARRLARVGGRGLAAIFRIDADDPSPLMRGAANALPLAKRARIVFDTG
jgi:hypothetical protein